MFESGKIFYIFIIINLNNNLFIKYGKLYFTIISNIVRLYLLYRGRRYWEIKLKWKLHNWWNKIQHCSDLVFTWNSMMLDIA